MTNPRRNPGHFSRRQFIKTSAVAAGALLLPPLAWAETNAVAPAGTVKRTAVDQVTLGRTGIKLSRLGFGTGSGNGAVQIADGKDAFVSLVHYAYDQGVTYFDTSEHYQTFNWIAAATKGLPREKLFIQSKVDGQPADVLAAIDSHRKTLNTDYMDSLLVHCMMDGQWTDQWKRVMDAFDVARGTEMDPGQRRFVPHAAGVAGQCGVGLAGGASGARESPRQHIDSEEDGWNKAGNDVVPEIRQIKTMHAKGRGVIGMKISATARSPSGEREKSIRFAMARREIDAVVIGFKNRPEIDEAIERINRALAET